MRANKRIIISQYHQKYRRLNNTTAILRILALRVVLSIILTVKSENIFFQLKEKYGLRSFMQPEEAGEPATMSLVLPLKSRSGADLLLFGVISRLVTCVFLAFGAPTGRFHSFRKIYQIFDGNSQLLPLYVLDRSCCNRSNFDFEPLQTN